MHNIFNYFIENDKTHDSLFTV